MTRSYTWRPGEAPVPTDDIVESERSRRENLSVARDVVRGFVVSTVFLGSDHNWFGGPPLLFETMVFAREGAFTDLYCERYGTETEARVGHARAVKIVVDGSEDWCAFDATAPAKGRLW